jgi:hypothetical protein
VTERAVDAVLAAATDHPDVTVTADLTVQRGGVEVTVTSYTDLVRVEFESLTDAVRFARVDGGDLETLLAGTVATGLTVAVHVGRSRVALLGTDAAPGPITRRLLGEWTQVSVRGLVQAVLPV